MGSARRSKDRSGGKGDALCLWHPCRWNREPLSFRLVDAEEKENWKGFLVDLKGRGLKGQYLELIIVDGNPALLRVLREIYPLRRIQRCIARKLRNGVAKPKRAQRASCMAEIERIIYGVAKNLNGNWKEHPLREIQQNC